MRTFVIVTPGLSIGKQGSHLTAAQMRMSDDKLDAFVEAGHAIEVFDEASPPAEGEAPDDVDLDELASSGQLPDLGVGDKVEPEPPKPAKKTVSRRPAAKKKT